MTIDLTKSGALTLESVRDLIASASGETHTQLRVTKAGIAYMSTTAVGSQDIEDLAFRLETFAEGTGYVGPEAAKDDKWVERIYQVLRENWPKPRDTYLDMY